jgi:hypothetical protein
LRAAQPDRPALPDPVDAEFAEGEPGCLAERAGERGPVGRAAVVARSRERGRADRLVACQPLPVCRGDQPDDLAGGLRRKGR